MLVLTRRNGESIVLTTADGEILITVLQMKPTEVRIGIKAPKGVRIDRMEVHRRKEAEKKYEQLKLEGL